jgi:hypothetical protein
VSESCRADYPPRHLEKLPTPKHNALTATCWFEPNIIAAEIQVTASHLLASRFALFATDGISTSPTQLGLSEERVGLFYRHPSISVRVFASTVLKQVSS